MGKNGNIRHFRMLHNSCNDDIALSQEVYGRFCDLCAAWEKIRGEQLIPPKDLDGDLLRWRQMAVRHKRKDYRNTDAELDSLHVVAQWTVNMNCDLRGQPRKEVKWREDR